MERDPRLSTFVHTNVLLANLCDRKKLCDNGTPFSPSPQAPESKSSCTASPIGAGVAKRPTTCQEFYRKKRGSLLTSIVRFHRRLTSVLGSHPGLQKLFRDLKALCLCICI